MDYKYSTADRVKDLGDAKVGNIFWSFGSYALKDTAISPYLYDFSGLNIQKNLNLQPRYYTDYQTRLFKFLLSNFLIQNGEFENIVNHIIRNEVATNAFTEYKSAGSEILNSRETRIDLKHDTEDDIDLLYMTFIMKMSVQEAHERFDAFIDDFLEERDESIDKIEVNIEMQ